MTVAKFGGQDVNLAPGFDASTRVYVGLRALIQASHNDPRSDKIREIFSLLFAKFFETVIQTVILNSRTNGRLKIRKSGY
jgi:hypothetical protein